MRMRACKAALPAAALAMAAYACRGSPPCEDGDIQADASRACAPVDAPADFAYVAVATEASMPDGGEEEDASGDGPERRSDAARTTVPPL